MHTRFRSFTVAITLGLAVASFMPSHLGAQTDQYEVTITNLTAGQTFTPILVASHTPEMRLFTLGQPVGQDLEILAEAGDTQPLRALLTRNPNVLYGSR